MYLVRFYHGGLFVGEEVLKAKDFFHASRLALYVANTVCRSNGVEPVGVVTWEVHSL